MFERDGAIRRFWTLDPATGLPIDPLDHEAFRAERALDDARAAGDAAAITQAERQLATAREALCGPSR